MKKNWSENDINFLIENYPLYGREYCSINLDRTKESIYSKVKELKINRKFLGQTNKWSLNDINFIKSNYSIHGSDFVAKALNREILDIVKKANSLNIKYSPEQSEIKNNKRGFKLRSNKVNHETFLKFNTPEIVYILGLIWGDGNINVNLSRIVVNMIESDMVELINVFRKTGDWNVSKPIKKFLKNKRVKNQLCVSTHNILLVNELIKYKFDLKSYVNPQILLESIDKIYHSYFFRGFFDADGNMSISCDGRNYIRIRFSGTYDYDWSFFNLIDINYKCYRYITKQGRYSQITISKQKDAIKFMNFIYSGSKFGLSRKYNKWINYEKK